MNKHPAQPWCSWVDQPSTGLYLELMLGAGPHYSAETSGRRGRERGDREGAHDSVTLRTWLAITFSTTPEMAQRNLRALAVTDHWQPIYIVSQIFVTCMG